ncbi:MAG: class I SAM-dependent methyltransferase [Saprospiraceae bacterium]|nr:class I SAM-dependent methyltransferase [Saprospiraceae bacterium]
MLRLYLFLCALTCMHLSFGQLLSLKAERMMQEDPEWKVINTDLEHLDSLLQIVKDNFVLTEMNSDQMDSLVLFIRLCDQPALIKLFAKPVVQHDLALNNLEAEYLREFARQYGQLFYRSQQLNFNYLFYNKNNNYVSNLSRWKKELARYQIPEGARVLDVGNGNSDLFKVMIRKFHGSEIYLNDIDQAVLKALKFTLETSKRLNRILKKNNNQVFIVEGSYAGTRVEHLTFDVIILRNTLHHLQNFECMMESIKQSMLPSTKLVVVEIFKDEGSFCPQGISSGYFYELMESQGFVLEKVTPTSKNSTGHIYHFTFPRPANPTFQAID